MLFYAYEFIFLFVPIVLIGYALLSGLNRRAAILWIVLASLFFYGYWKPVYLWLIVVSIAANYFVGRQLHRRQSPGWLTLGIAFNLGLIGYYKYANFVTANVRDVTGWAVQLDTIVLPLAISFFTFQQIAYLVDVYRRQVVRHDLLDYVLFVTFFPQLIAGPIVHQAEMLPQFARRDRFTLRSSDFAVGLTIFTIGLFKKIVLADGIAVHVAPTFDNAAAGQAVTFLEAWGAALSYTFQLYFDFSGYSDMAIGLARLFGIRLPLNFNSPYKSRSIIEFWRRWHMTLSRFLSHYLYFPLGGSRRGAVRRYGNLMIVMLLGGLWHGANWTFVVWGGLHGVLLMVNHGWRALHRRRPGAVRLPGWLTASLAWLLTFTALVVSWVLFRADTLEAAGLLLYAMAGLGGSLAWPQEFAGGAAPLLLSLGVRLVPRAEMAGFGGVTQVIQLAALLVVVLLAPNTQQWMARYRPAFEPVKLFRNRWQRALLWRPTLPFGVLVGGGFMVAVLSYWTIDTVPEFIYFNF